MSKRRKFLIVSLLLLAFVPFCLPPRAIIPVQGGSQRDWSPQSFWYEPWGASGVHKGIDIFAPRGRPVLSSTYGLVVYSGTLARGGRAVAVLGPWWRLHYYAHLDSAQTATLSLMRPGSVLGTVGDSGNARGKPPHLHYAILSLIPRPWRAVGGTQGWKRMFFVDPGAQFAGA